MTPSIALNKPMENPASNPEAIDNIDAESNLLIITVRRRNSRYSYN